MCGEKELRFAIWILYILAENWKKTPAEVYMILNRTGILDNYIIAGYDVLHTLGKEYLIDDITTFVAEKNIYIKKRADFCSFY